MKWPKLLGFLVGALGIGMLCCCGPHTFGTGLRDIHNGMDSWPRVSFVTLNVFAGLLIALSYFLYYGRNWARITLMAACIGYCILALGGAVLMGVDDANLPDIVFIAGLLILCVAGPLILFFILWRPEVRNDFVGIHARQARCSEAGGGALVGNRDSVAPGR
jgi:hypothetical protein